MGGRKERKKGRKNRERNPNQTPKSSTSLHRSFLCLITFFFVDILSCCPQLIARSRPLLLSSWAPPCWLLSVLSLLLTYSYSPILQMMEYCFSRRRGASTQEAVMAPCRPILQIDRRHTRAVPRMSIICESMCMWPDARLLTLTRFLHNFLWRCSSLLGGGKRRGPLGAPPPRNPHPNEKRHARFPYSLKTTNLTKSPASIYNTNGVYVTPAVVVCSTHVVVAAVLLHARRLDPLSSLL